MLVENEEISCRIKGFLLFWRCVMQELFKVKACPIVCYLHAWLFSKIKFVMMVVIVVMMAFTAFILFMRLVISVAVSMAVAVMCLSMRMLVFSVIMFFTRLAFVIRFYSVTAINKAFVNPKFDKFFLKTKLAQ